MLGCVIATNNMPEGTGDSSEKETLTSETLVDQGKNWDIRQQQGL